MYMACLDEIMYNKKSDPPLMSPRISFSNDLVESSHSHHSYRDAPVSSDFEFSVNNDSMITADELFSKGKLLPFKGRRPTTLRDELQTQDPPPPDYKPPKNPTKLTSFLGFTRPLIASKKSAKSQDHVQCSKNLQGSVE